MCASVLTYCSYLGMSVQDVLHQLLRLGALADVPDDLQWTARMLLPKSTACPLPAEPRNPQRRPAPSAPPPAAWASEPAAAAALQHSVPRPFMAEVAARPAALAADSAAPVLQPLPLPAGPTAFGAPQQHAMVSSVSAQCDLAPWPAFAVCLWLRVMLETFLC